MSYIGMRTWRKLLLLLNIVLLALLVAGAFLTWRRDRAEQARIALTSGRFDGAELQTAAGVNLQADELAPESIDATLEALRSAGINWVRLRVPWSEIEAEPGRWQWQRWDAVFAALGRFPEIELLPVLDGSPRWARSPEDSENDLAPPRERADFGRFAAAFANRYGAQVRYYQIWDEPNIAPHWGSRPVDAADYAGLLREAANMVRAVDANALIVLAALAPTTEPGGANLSDVAFFDGLYGSGAGPFFDVAAAQPYGFVDKPEAPAAEHALNFGRAALLRQVMLQHGDTAKPIWATSFGWNASVEPTPWGSVGENLQAEYLAGAYSLAGRQWPWMGPMFWASLCPSRVADATWSGFSLCRSSGNWRPAWQAMTNHANRQPILGSGEHSPNHPALAYESGWRVTPLAADPGHDGDSLSFSFLGTALALRVQGGPFWAYYTITVDGLPANALPRDESGVSYLVLHDPQAQERLVTVATGLSEEAHRVKIEAHGGWGQWALHGIAVGGAAEEARSNWPAWALLAALTAAMLLWSGRPFGPQVRQAYESANEWADRWSDFTVCTCATALVLTLSLSRWLAVDILCVGALAALFVLRPNLALPLVALALPLWPFAKPVLNWQFSIYEILLWLGIAAVTARSLLDGGRHRLLSHFRLRGLDWPVAALLLAAILAGLAADNRRVALRELHAVFLLGGAIYWLASRQPTRQGRRFSPWPAVNGLLVGMVLVSLLALGQLVSGHGRIDVEGVWRVRGPYGSPNNLALVLDRGVPLALAAALAGGFGRRRSIAYAFVTAVLVSATVATFSKGGLLLGLPAGIGAVLLLGAGRAPTRLSKLAAAIGGLLAVAGLALLFRTERFAGLFDFKGGTSFIRLRLWQGAWNMALDHPWLGVGPDNFLYAYRSHYVLPSAWQELNLSHPHNLVLDLWTRLGVPGVVAGIWAIIASARAAWRQLDGPQRALALGTLGSLAATLMHGLIDNSLFLIDLMALFMLVLGLLQRLGVDPRGQGMPTPTAVRNADQVSEARCGY